METKSQINQSTQMYENLEPGVLFITNTGAKVSLVYFVACLITLIVAGWIISLNGIVIHTLLYRKVYNDVTDYFVSSLSIADMVTGLVLVYVTSYSMFQYQNLRECLFRFGLTYVVSHSSFGHILAITIDRYVKIKYPLKYFTLFTKKTVIIISSTIWISSIVIGLLPLLGWYKEYKSQENSVTVCKFFGVLPDEYFIFNLTVSIIPSVGTLSLYLGIIVEAVRMQKRMETLREGMHTCNSPFHDHTWKFVKTVAIIVLLSNLCWMPGSITIVLHISGHLERMSIESRGDLITYCGLFIFLNSLINPLIYAVKIDAVKTRFKRLCCCSEQPGVRLPITSRQERIELLNT